MCSSDLGQYGLSELVANQKQLRSELREKDQSRDAEREAAGDASNFEAECLELRSILRQQDEMLAEKAGTIADREVRRTGDLTHQVHHLEGVIAQQRSHIRELETDKERLVGPVGPELCLVVVHLET